ncbi:uncharacterized protein PRCAT00005921001 [Priceomyces carsonii]|uniref:uncharacterized protein n=1 Tax=Priceomyces carsonii TaxID=28549 RepID=UPI002ED81216|nr:unnamed protein product [Priceomyces carsonii]
MRISTATLCGLNGVKRSFLKPFKPIFFSGYLNYSTSADGPKSSIYSVENRSTGKHILSRKTFLVDYYKYLNDRNEVLLYVHHNNITKPENKRLRSEIKKAGGQLNIIRNSIYNIYLRSENDLDPADAATSTKNRNVTHPLSPLLSGPTGVITIPKCDPSAVAQILKVIKGAQEKLILIGAKVELNVYDVKQVDQFKDLPNKEQLQSQLAGLLTVLGGAGLVRTLEAAGNTLYLTLEERRKDMEPKKSETNSTENNED